MAETRELAAYIMEQLADLGDVRRAAGAKAEEQETEKQLTARRHREGQDVYRGKKLDVPQCQAFGIVSVAVLF